MSKPESQPTREPCPECRGGGTRRGFFHDGNRSQLKEVPCSLCAGRGSLTFEQAQWWTFGTLHRTARVERGEGLRACACRLGLTLKELSDMEHARADPARLVAAMKGIPLS